MEERLPLAPTRVPAWSWLVVSLALALAYLVTLDNGAVLQGAANVAHELFHDGRHFLGVPCH
ncbi:MAG: CbtB-domain containing protein [Acidimicrobiales bacterium]